MRRWLTAPGIATFKQPTAPTQAGRTEPSAKMLPRKTGTIFKVVPCILALCASGCTLISPRPINALRTVTFSTPGSPETDEAEIEDLLDRYTNSRLIPGNRYEYLENGDQAYPKMLAAIRNARHRVSLATYDYEDDDTGRDFLAALTDAAARGVKVRLVYDHVGSSGLSPRFFAPLTEAGGEVRVFNPSKNWTVLRYNNRNHRKILVIDGQTSFMGGLNVADHYQGDGVNGWRDMALQVEGPASTAAEEVFAQTWNQAGAGWLGKEPALVGLNWLKHSVDKPLMAILNTEYNPPKEPVPCFGDISIRVIAQAPGWMDSYMLNMYLVLVNTAKESVYITNPYFIPPETLKRALINAARRGVDVRILTQGQTDLPIITHISQNTFRRLLAGGVKIYSWEKSILHGKKIIVDSRQFSVGSTNLDGRALFLNYEANFLVNDPVFSSQLAQQFLKDISHSRQYNLEECNEISRFPAILLAPFWGQF